MALQKFLWVSVWCLECFTEIPYQVVRNKLLPENPPTNGVFRDGASQVPREASAFLEA